MQYLLLGTRNPGKLREYHELLEVIDSPGGFRRLDLDSAGVEVEVEETGATYLENATRKAVAYATASGLVALADDSGLEVDALGGRPGILTARFAPQPEATDADRRRYLLALLHGVEPPWKARFRCVVVIARESQVLFTSEGVCEGEISPVERGGFGFGYDPIFLIPETGQTMAELGPAIKNRISHRARALAPAGLFLRSLYSNYS